MTDIPLTITGNITKTPVVQYLRGNKAILRMTVASTPRYYSKAEQGYVEGETTFMPIEVRSSGSEKHNYYVEELTEQFQSGDRVIVTGNLVTRSRQDGNETHRWNVLMAEEIGFSTRYTKVTPHRKRPRSEPIEHRPVEQTDFSHQPFSHLPQPYRAEPPLAGLNQEHYQ